MRSETRAGSQQHHAGCWTETYKCECSRDRPRSLPPAPVPQPPPMLVLAPSPSMPYYTPNVAPTQASQVFTFSVHAPTVAQPISTTPAAPVKRTPTQSTLAGWLTGTSKSTTKTPPAPASGAQAVGHSEEPASCGGRLHITVEEVAHPLGYYTGQKVTVVLEHPQR